MDNRYIYYRIYNEDGALPVRNPVGSDSILGRIMTHSVTPPHNVRNIRHRIAVDEQLPYRYKPDMYLHMDRDAHNHDECRVSLSGDSYPGSSPESAIGLVISGARHSDGSRPLMCVEGEWTVEEREFTGTYTLYMVDDSTFTGHGSETDRTKSCKFSIIDGKITSDGKVTWLCTSPGIGQWRIKAVLTRNNMQMEGYREAVWGNALSGSGIYRRVSRPWTGSMM